MSSGQVHFEVFARRRQNSPLALELATEDRARALAYAEELLGLGSCAVRVSKEILDPETGEYASVVILAKGTAAAKEKKAPDDSGPACVSPADLYTVHARQRIVRLLDGWLHRHRVIPFELLHRPDLAERLEASTTDLQHAVQKIAIPEAQAKGCSVHEVIRTFNSLIERAIARLIQDGRKGAFADFKKEPFAMACARLAGQPEGAYQLGGGVAGYLSDAKTWADKIHRLLDLADQAPVDPRLRALAFQVLEQPLGEILGSKAGMADLLGPDLDLGSRLAAMTRLIAGQAVEMMEKFDPAIGRAIPPLEGPAQRLSLWMQGSHFQAVRLAVGKQVISEIKGSRRLRPSDPNGEIDVLRALAMALTAAAGKLLPADEIRDGFIERSSMLIGAEFVTAAVSGAESAYEEVRILLRLAENVTGPTNKGQAAKWLIGAVTALRFEREMRGGAESPMARLGALADLQRAMTRVELPEADRVVLARRLGDVGGLIEADAKIVAAVLRAPLSSVQRLTHLLKMAMGETVPTGPAAVRARDAVVKLSQSPDVRADLAKAPELIDKLRPMLMAS
jgi:hypothetical protein